MNESPQCKWREIKEAIFDSLNTVTSPENSTVDRYKVLTFNISVQCLSLRSLLSVLVTQKKGLFKSHKMKSESLFLGESIRFSSKYNDYMKQSSLIEHLKELGASIYGGVCFQSLNDKKDEVWRDMDENYFFVPLITIKKDHHKHLKVIVTFDTECQTLDDVIKSIKEQLKSNATCEEKTMKVKERRDIPAFKIWKKNVESVLSKVNRKELEKVVLARKTIVTFDEKISEAWLESVIESEPLCSVYYHKWGKDSAYLSITPETLFLRKGNTIESDSIAGTIKNGKSRIETKQQSDTLKTNKKEKNEHKIVLTALRKVYESCCEKYDVKKEYDVLTLAHLQHLKTVISGTLKENITDFEILKQLHPTPAIGGSPRYEALKTIQEQESFNRGLYAGAVGEMSKDYTEFLVGIRSCLVVDKDLHLFVGAGIVEGSEPDKEWEELNLKSESYLSLIPSS
ncbi:hypothetical protein DID78_02510 [Candidatus Marinamargulisbacteria bacterium SCGC AG-343-D04]|nr:hypothetical protein DID78_02510 [Candidatus Marinamargulisbacteria bacterium SCGC AG-343-D04]